jgi:hypothetical protein
MDWLESGIFCAVRADGCARNNEYSDRGTAMVSADNTYSDPLLNITVRMNTLKSRFR